VISHGEKVRAGQERARAQGAHVGRRCNQDITPDLLERVRSMRASGICLRDAAATLGVPKSTLHRALRRDDERVLDEGSAQAGAPTRGNRRPRESRERVGQRGTP
jgi:DNA invertase Pin-like site-specific DNA recombinase